VSNSVPKVKISKVLSDTGSFDYNNISINFKVTFFRQIFHFHFYFRKLNFTFQNSKKVLLTKILTIIVKLLLSDSRWSLLMVVAQHMPSPHRCQSTFHSDTDDECQWLSIGILWRDVCLFCCEKRNDMGLVSLNQWFPNCAPWIHWDPRSSSKVIPAYISVMVTLKCTYCLN